MSLPKAPSPRSRGQQRLFSSAEPDAAAAAPEAAPAPPSPGPTPAEAEGPHAYTVTEALSAIEQALDQPHLASIWVRGEISGFKEAASGHWYFLLKDGNAVLQCAMWRQRSMRVRFRPDDGLEVLARGSIEVYKARGSVQLVVDELRPEGVGALQLAFEQLKRKLEAEGLFSGERKRELPRFPGTVGVVTSRAGAVWHDIQREARRRFPGIHLIIKPVRVQGEGAAQEVAEAIGHFNRHAAADVLIVGRGGGSLEDLWAFNEEAVVRAIAASDIPIISAVGHETDVTLADFAADARAATPTQAAALATPDARGVVEALLDWEARGARALTRRRDEARRRADDAAERLAQAARVLVERKRALVAERAAALDALSPLAVLARGYAVATDPSGRPVRSVRAVAPDSGITIRLSDGRVRAVAKEVEPDGASSE